MRVHTNHLTETDLRKALKNAESEAPDVTLHILGQFGSQRFARSYEVALRGHGQRHTQHPQTAILNANIRERAATRDDWGWFIAAVYDLDTAARFGPYRDQDDFRKLFRFAAPTSELPAGRHK